MSRENLELVRAVFPPPGTDFARLIRDENGFALIREALSPLVTDDFESLMGFPVSTERTPVWRAIEKTGATGSSRGRLTEPRWTS